MADHIPASVVADVANAIGETFSSASMDDWNAEALAAIDAYRAHLTAAKDTEITRLREGLSQIAWGLRLAATDFTKDFGDGPSDTRDVLGRVLDLATSLPVRSCPGRTDDVTTPETGAQLIAAERARHQTLGWTVQHDAEHAGSSLVIAACCYALPPTMRRFKPAADVPSVSVPTLWPWDAGSWKPGDRLRELAKAGALIAAEIDRLNGATAEALSSTEDTPVAHVHTDACMCDMVPMDVVGASECHYCGPHGNGGPCGSRCEVAYNKITATPAAPEPREWPALDDRVASTTKVYNTPAGSPGTVTLTAGQTVVVRWDHGGEDCVYARHLRPLSEVASPGTTGEPA